MFLAPLGPTDMNPDNWLGRFKQTWGNPSWWSLLIALPWAIFVIFSLSGVRADQATASREQTIGGRIVSHDPPNHNRYGYEFVVNGRVYTGWSIPVNGEFKIGQQVLVYYDPLDPAKSQLDDFAENGYRIIGPVFACLCGICCVSVFIILQRRRARSNLVRLVKMNEV